MGFFDTLKGLFTLDSFYAEPESSAQPGGAVDMGDTQQSRIPNGAFGLTSTESIRNGPSGLPDLSQTPGQEGTVMTNEGRLVEARRMVSQAARQIDAVLQHKLHLPPRPSNGGHTPRDHS